jgi:chemotaxis protein histidine kinase CheA
MESVLSPSNITFALGIIGLIFSIFLYFKKPQEDLEKQQAINEERDKGKATVLAQTEAQGKAALLAQQVEQEKQANQQRFIEFGQRLDGSLTLAQNHIHTVDTKVDNLTNLVSELSNNITRLQTIIEERIPRK